jgi:predicted membrane protein
LPIIKEKIPVIRVIKYQISNLLAEFFFSASFFWDVIYTKKNMKAAPVRKALLVWWLVMLAIFVGILWTKDDVVVLGITTGLLAITFFVTVGLIIVMKKKETMYNNITYAVGLHPDKPLSYFSKLSALHEMPANEITEYDLNGIDAIMTAC